MKFKHLPKLKQGDKVAILSPSFAAPAVWPEVYELGLKRLREDFGLIPVEYPATKKKGASGEERAKDLIAAFEDPEIKAVIAVLGGDDQITYIKNLPKEVFQNNPKPFFGYSDNTHFINHLWLCGVPAFYGGSIFTEFAMQGYMDSLTVEYLKHALFDEGEFELKASEEFNDEGVSWNDSSLLDKRRRYQKNEGWYWDGMKDTQGVLWGGCAESIDELLRHNVEIPTMEEFENIVLYMETSEELPAASYVRRILRALGERGMLSKIQGVLVGRPKAWEFDRQNSDEEKEAFKKEQRDMFLEIVRKYNMNIPIVQNMDFGHTAPQISLASGKKVRIISSEKKIFMEF